MVGSCVSALGVTAALRGRLFDTSKGLMELTQNNDFRFSSSENRLLLNGKC
jgi:hypothetical protein